LTAAKAIMDDGRFKLYTKLMILYPMQEILLKITGSSFSDENNIEVIFQKAYTRPDKQHGYDNHNYPQSFKPGCCGNALLRLLKWWKSMSMLTEHQENS